MTRGDGGPSYEKLAETVDELRELRAGDVCPAPGRRQQPRRHAPGGTTTDGNSYTWQPAMLAEGKLVFDDDPLASNVRWRFAAGDPAPDAPVDGVVTDRSRFVLRTDSTVVEAMLGQADAPDPYESARQALELMHRQSRVAALEAKTAQVTGHILQETTPESSKQPKGTHA